MAAANRRRLCQGPCLASASARRRSTAMIIVDKALAAREATGNPIRVGMIGAGALGRALAEQIIGSVKGMRLVAISNRHIGSAQAAYAGAGIESVRRCATKPPLEDAIARGQYAVTEDVALLCRAKGIDALIEATGTVEFGAQVTLEAIQQGKHMVLVNAE